MVASNIAASPSECVASCHAWPMEAHERLALVSLPAEPGVVQAAIEHMERLVDNGALDNNDASDLRLAAAALSQHGNMSGDVERAWRALRSRLQDPRVITIVDGLDSRVARGACSGGEVSAATLGFIDGSYLILVDHGLATLTWLAAGLTVTTADPAVCARAIRLALARPATRNRAGPTPSLALSSAEIRRAGALVNEMDVFLLGHELAHILLGHVADGGLPVGAVGGSAQLVGKEVDAELAADLLALTLLFDDMSEPAVDRDLARLRISAVRLFLAVLERFELQCFVLQPSSHPAAARRWDHMASVALTHWFDEIPPLYDRVADLLSALQELGVPPALQDDADAVVEGLDAWLDHALWHHQDWQDLATMNALLLTPGRLAVQTLLTWPGWGKEDVDTAIEDMVTIALKSSEVRGAIRRALDEGVPLTRIELVERVDAALESDVPRSALNQPFPTWAIAAVVGDVVRRAQEAGVAHGT